MKVCLVSRYLWPPRFGGAELWTHRIASLLGPSASLVCRWTRREGGPYPYEIIRVGGQRSAILPDRLREPWLRRRLLSLAPREVSIWHACEAAEIPWALALARRWGGAVVAAASWLPCRNLPPEQWPPVHSRSEARRQDEALRERRWLARCDAVVVASDYMRGLVEGFVEQERLFLVPCGLDHPQQLPPLPTGPPNVLFIGRLSPGKGVAALLAAWRMARSRLGNATLTVAGEGDRREVERVASDPENAIAYAGYVEGEGRERLFSRAGAVAMPSDYPESWGLSGLEGMARGRPVIGTAFGGQAEYLKAGVNGWVAAPGSVEPLAEALIDAVETIRERRRWEEFSQAALSTAEPYTWERNLTEIGHVWEETLGRARASEAALPDPERMAM